MDDAVSQSFKPKTSSLSSFRHFLFRAAVLALVLVLIPSLAPEFVNSAIHARSWELLQLIFVGLAVSYGLFSKKNDESDKDYNIQSCNTQTYLSRLLHVSSIFDEESEVAAEIEGNDAGKVVNKWSLMHQKVSPVTVIAKGEEKPLLLPVRTLKQRNEEPEGGGEEERKSSFVLPPLIPRRSRLKEMKKTFSIPSPPPPPPPPRSLKKMKSNSGIPSRTLRSPMAEEVKKYVSEEEEEEGVVESSESSESDGEKDDYTNRGSPVEKEDLGPDVDKKADEFIAKFREQIRLQRIESIRRSTAQRSALASSKGSSFN